MTSSDSCPRLAFARALVSRLRGNDKALVRHRSNALQEDGCGRENTDEE
jgi:hypothetical protein